MSLVAAHGTVYRPMTEKNSDPQQPAPHAAAKNLTSLEELDRELAQLLQRRVELAQEAMDSDQHPAASSTSWEADWHAIERVIDAVEGPLPKAALRSIYREILGSSRALFQPVRVLYLGPQYSYSHLAAVERFGDSAELVPVSTIPSVFQALDRKQADFGLVPVENSTDGRIADTLDMFARLPVRVCGEVQLCVHHHLLAKCRRSEVKKIYSKPQAISQCRGWLAQQMPDVETEEMTSTAAAAKLASEQPGAAAIASRQAGLHNGLDIVASNIEDNQHNMTRFAVIGNLEPPPTGRDKTSLMFELHHLPGTLADVMGIFKQERLNLTWIESFPMSETPNEYVFFVEFEGHRQESAVQRALAAIGEKTVRLEILGSYPMSPPTDSSE